MKQNVKIYFQLVLNPSEAHALYIIYMSVYR